MARPGRRTGRRPAGPPAAAGPRCARTTSAPRSASSIPAIRPARVTDASSTRTPASAATRSPTAAPSPWPAATATMRHRPRLRAWYRLCSWYRHRSCYRLCSWYRHRSWYRHCSYQRTSGQAPESAGRTGSPARAARPAPPGNTRPAGRPAAGPRVGLSPVGIGGPARSSRPPNRSTVEQTSRAAGLCGARRAGRRREQRDANEMTTRPGPGRAPAPAGARRSRAAGAGGCAR